MAEGIVMREAHFPGRAPIDAYGNGGFRFADMSHRGSMLCLPSGISRLGTEGPGRADGVEISSACSPQAMRSRYCWLARGKDLRPLPKALRAALREAQISADPMSTGAAVRTFNVLLAEDRAVAAALIAVD